MSCATQILGTVIQPVLASTSASTTQAVKLYAGEGPTPAPLYLPGAFGGAYEPTAPSVPNFVSVAVTASTKLIVFAAFSAANTLPRERTTRSGKVSSFSAAATTICSRPRMAAGVAALPIIAGTRFEYEPRSIGVSP